jgi:hypothetical protein
MYVTEENVWTLEERNNRKRIKLSNEHLHNLYSSSNIINVIKFGSMRRTGHVARTGNMEDAYKL